MAKAKSQSKSKKFDLIASEIAQVKKDLKKLLALHKALSDQIAQLRRALTARQIKKMAQKTAVLKKVTATPRSAAKRKPTRPLLGPASSATQPPGPAT